MRARDDTMIERPSYTRLLRQYRDQALIKIVTGVRRAGKSTLFQLFIRELKEQGIAEEQIQTLNLEVVDNEALLDYRRLYQHVKEHLAEGKQNYVFLDEIQNVPDFQKAVRSLADRGQETCYFQVCETIRDAATLERELRPLRAIRDSHPKFLLTRDYDSVQFDGIRHLNVLKWLLGEE